MGSKGWVFSFSLLFFLSSPLQNSYCENADFKPCFCILNTCCLNQAGLTTWSLHAAMSTVLLELDNISQLQKRGKTAAKAIFLSLTGCGNHSLKFHIVPQLGKFASNLMLLPVQWAKTNLLTFNVIEIIIIVIIFRDHFSKHLLWALSKMDKLFNYSGCYTSESSVLNIPIPSDLLNSVFLETSIHLSRYFN